MLVPEMYILILVIKVSYTFPFHLSGCWMKIAGCLHTLSSPTTLGPAERSVPRPSPLPPPTTHKPDRGPGGSRRRPPRRLRRRRQLRRVGEKPSPHRPGELLATAQAAESSDAAAGSRAVSRGWGLAGAGGAARVAWLGLDSPPADDGVRMRRKRLNSTNPIYRGFAGLGALSEVHRSSESFCVGFPHPHPFTPYQYPGVMGPDRRTPEAASANRSSRVGRAAADAASAAALASP